MGFSTKPQTLVISFVFVYVFIYLFCKTVMQYHSIMSKRTAVLVVDAAINLGIVDEHHLLLCSPRLVTCGWCILPVRAVCRPAPPCLRAYHLLVMFMLGARAKRLCVSIISILVSIICADSILTITACGRVRAQKPCSVTGARVRKSR